MIYYYSMFQLHIVIIKYFPNFIKNHSKKINIIILQLYNMLQNILLQIILKIQMLIQLQLHKMLHNILLQILLEIIPKK